MTPEHLPGLTVRALAEGLAAARIAGFVVAPSAPPASDGATRTQRDDSCAR
jgi:hypothetical protein